MKNIIVIEHKNKYQYDLFEELVKDMIEEKYYDLSQEQKREILNRKANYNLLNKIGATVKSTIQENTSVSNTIITTNEYTFILSLANLDIITILEHKNANIFLEGYDKTRFEGNYIIINKLANELIMKYINSNVND